LHRAQQRPLVLPNRHCLKCPGRAGDGQGVPANSCIRSAHD
jgi:hypothetical protein